jgi:hypothetical protein
LHRITSRRSTTLAHGSRHQKRRAYRPWTDITEPARSGRAGPSGAILTAADRLPLADVGEAAWVSGLPLVERLSPGSGLWGEPGVAYLVRTPNTALLFDYGLAPVGPPRGWLLEDR